MSIAFFIYLAGLCGDITGLCIAICVFCAVTLFICGILYVDNHEYCGGEGPVTDEKVFKYGKKAIVVAFFAALVATFMPSTNTMYMIAGTEAAKSVIDTPEFQKTRQLLNNKLDDLLKTSNEEKK